MNPGLGLAPELIWFRGPDAVRFLNDLISQEIGTSEVGTVSRSLLLAPQGKLLFILWVLRGQDEVGLATEDGRGEELAATLGRYRIRVKVDIEPEARPVCLVIGKSAIDRGHWQQEGDGLRADVSWRSTRRELLVGIESPNLPILDHSTIDDLRISDGEPIMGVDVDETTIPQETGLVPETISFTKGCFLGQELVARLDSRGGRVNHHLRLLDFTGPAPDVGTELISDDRKVGTLTSTSGGRGMAMLWREVMPGSTVRAGGVEAVVREYPQKTAGSFTTS